jgi:hypothetical protein
LPKSCWVLQSQRQQRHKETTWLIRKAEDWAAVCQR